MENNMSARGGSAFGGKICLYLEFLNFLGGFLYKDIGTGLLSSYKNQKKSLEAMGIPYTEKWSDDCDILQINTPWLWSLWLIKKVRRQGKKVIIWSHVTVEDFRQVFRFNKYVAPLVKKYLTYAYGQADLVFCPTEYTKSLLVAYGLPADKLVAQSNGVDGRIFYPDLSKRESARKKYGCEGLVIGTAGLVIPRKGVDIFIELAKKYPQNQFIWFGKIYSSLMVKPLPKNLPQNVKFTGHIQDINAAYNALDIFIFLSSEENQGMVLLEASAVGLPILVKGLPAYQGWLIHDENCLIAQNDEEVTQYLDRLLKDPDLRARLSAGAKKLAIEEDIKTLNKKLLITYNNLLAK